MGSTVTYDFWFGTGFVVVKSLGSVTTLLLVGLCVVVDVCLITGFWVVGFLVVVIGFWVVGFVGAIGFWVLLDFVVVTGFWVEVGLVVVTVFCVVEGFTEVIGFWVVSVAGWEVLKDLEVVEGGEDVLGFSVVLDFWGGATFFCVVLGFIVVTCFGFSVDTKFEFWGLEVWVCVFPVNGFSVVSVFKDFSAGADFIEIVDVDKWSRKLSMSSLTALVNEFVISFCEVDAVVDSKGALDLVWILAAFIPPFPCKT